MSPLRCLLISTLMTSVLLHAVAQASTSDTASTHRDVAKTRVPRALAVRKELGPPPAGVTDLKFRDIFKLPAGPKGFEPTDKLVALDGKRVRVVGYMVQQDPLPKGAFLLSPLPVLLGDEDESLADDLPATTLRIDLGKSRDLAVPRLTGLIQVTGTLHVGMRADPASGRSTSAQLVLDEAPERALREVARDLAAQSKKQKHL